ncbi:MAG: hypothetical protein JWN22_717 [Nocardioides sp.]|nr:hypothetical protein [Nocardioides sp.]
MPSVLGALALLALVLAVVLMLGRARTERELRSARAEAGALRAQMDEIERRLPAPARPREPAGDPPDYVITHLGEEATAPRHSGAAPGDGPGSRVDPALFADLVLRETVVRAASLAHGVRVALAPEVRNRIRFEMRREVRRARKQRRAELKEARRQLEARQRATLTDDEDAA